METLDSKNKMKLSYDNCRVARNGIFCFLFLVDGEKGDGILGWWLTGLGGWWEGEGSLPTGWGG
ncbi:hypothetical protein GBA52_014195 [Prunus armeniaca]|nr:hypothetical protein GBA52_014195 [Prunus armeniaca]